MGTEKKTCLACKYCFCEPDDDFTCGHSDSGTMGLYVRRGPVAHCGNYTKFEQHPLRNADGSLKTIK